MQDCGEVTMDNSPHLFESEKSGQFICYKTGQVYLLLTSFPYFLDIQIRSAYTFPVNKQSVAKYT